MLSSGNLGENVCLSWIQKRGNISVLGEMNLKLVVAIYLLSWLCCNTCDNVFLFDLSSPVLSHNFIWLSSLQCCLGLVFSV